jgi:excisionase family DNA binding protein
MTTSTAPRTEQPAFSREDLLTATEVAEVLRLKRTTALDYMRRGVIPAFKLGRQWYALRPRLDAYVASASQSAEPR